MTLIKDYLRLSLFCVGLLLGIQIPALVDQYAKRVDAKLVEVSRIYTGFEQTAKRYFDGDVQRLINHYQQSDDAVFRQDAQNIRYIANRLTDLSAQQQAMQQNSLLRTMHVLFRHDQEILQETLAAYSYVIMLNPLAILWGLGLALMCSLVIELLLSVLLIVVRPRKVVNH